MHAHHTARYDPLPNHTEVIEPNLAEYTREGGNGCHDDRKRSVRLDKSTEAHKLTKEEHPYANLHHVVS